MSRLFGWDLPPGVSANDINEAFGDDDMNETVATEEPITEIDLATVEYYFAVCCECKKCTEDRADASDAVYWAKEAGYRMVDGLLYCGDCAETETRRMKDEAEEDAELGL